MNKAAALLFVLALLTVVLLMAEFHFVNLANADYYDDSMPQFYQTQSPPEIVVKSPVEHAVYGLSVPLKFTINYYETDPPHLIWGHHPIWLGYSIDDAPYVTIPPSTSPKSSGSSGSAWDTLTRGSTSIDILLDASALSNGLHVLTVKADFMFIIEQVNAGHYNYTFSSVNFAIAKPSLTSSILSPNNSIYNSSDISLNFTVNRQIVGLSWIGYSLDGQPNITISGNTTLTGLTDGFHSLVVYANDTSGNTAVSQTLDFTITKNEETPQEFPALLVATVSVIIVAVVAVGVLVYRKSRKSEAENQ